MVGDAVISQHNTPPFAPSVKFAVVNSVCDIPAFQFGIGLSLCQSVDKKAINTLSQPNNGLFNIVPTGLDKSFRAHPQISSVPVGPHCADPVDDCKDAKNTLSDGILPQIVSVNPNAPALAADGQI